MALQQAMGTSRSATLLRRRTLAFLRFLAFPRSPDEYLQALHPDWALERVVARVQDVRREARDTTSLYLQPSRNWRTHRAGQHVLLTVELCGVQYTRCFSLSAAQRGRAPLRITLKAYGEGLVSRWARDEARPGDRVVLSQAQGEFVLPEPIPDRLLFLSGGSGMTPLLAMAQALVDGGYRGSLRWLHSERNEVPLLDEMRAACAALDTKLDVHRTGGCSPSAPLTGADLAARVPDYRERHLFVCGPPGLADTATRLYAEADRAQLVHHEDFGTPRARALLAAANDAPSVLLGRSRRRIRAQPGLSFLELAELAGVHPPHGCRRGICQTCKCIKRFGTVRNVLTGAESSVRDEEIRLCIHGPITDVELDL
jgi:ferredoxin-NADP reductase